MRFFLLFFFFQVRVSFLLVYCLLERQETLLEARCLFYFFFILFFLQFFLFVSSFLLFSFCSGPCQFPTLGFVVDRFLCLFSSILFILFYFLSFNFFLFRSSSLLLLLLSRSVSVSYSWFCCRPFLRAAGIRPSSFLEARCDT